MLRTLEIRHYGPVVTEMGRVRLLMEDLTVLLSRSEELINEGFFASGAYLQEDLFFRGGA